MVLAFHRVAQFSAQNRHHLCPRCGARLERQERTGVIVRFLLLRIFRCTTECGWRGLRFSRSRLRARRQQLKTAVVVALFIVTAAVTVHYMLSRASSRASGTHDDGVQEVE
jgi:hypothetical protein